MEEAICHALCEIVSKRLDRLLSEFVSSAFQYHILKTIENSLFQNGINVNHIESKKFIDDNRIYPDVDLNDIDSKSAKKLLKRFENCQIPLIVKDITSRSWYPHIYSK